MNSSLMDFLTFKTFISIQALMVFYYLGAVVLPVGIWYLSQWLTGKFQMIEALQQQGKELIWNKLSRQQKLKLLAVFVVIFLFMELFWRMLFEYLIAYIQIRDALLR